MIEFELRLSTPGGLRSFFVLVPEMRPTTLTAILDKADWQFDAKTGSWKLNRDGLKAELREVHTIEHDDHFDVILTGPKAWQFVEALLDAMR